MKTFLKTIFLAVGIAVMFCSTGCNVKSASKLHQEAKQKYGKCTVISKEEKKDFTKVILHDSLQDFDYEIVSSQSDITIDGASFGSLPSTSDTFMKSLNQKVLSDCKEQLSQACSENNAYYEQAAEYLPEILIEIHAENMQDGENAAIACGNILQEQNKENRLDNRCIKVYGMPNEYDTSDYYGKVVFPEVHFQDEEEEKIQYFLSVARSQTDENAEYLRKEKGTFADTGADLNHVVKTLGGSGYPEHEDSEVTFYYFKASDGEEYYVCDFNYYFSEYKQKSLSFAYYTNYSGTEW